MLNIMENIALEVREFCICLYCAWKSLTFRHFLANFATNLHSCKKAAGMRGYNT